MAKGLTLIANPGSASRKYALFDGSDCRLRLHFEYMHHRVRCTITGGPEQVVVPTDLRDVSEAAMLVRALMQQHGGLADQEQIGAIGLRVVAPSSFFQEDRLLSEAAISRLEALKPRAPLHIAASLDELRQLRQQFGEAAIYGLSDSAFHAKKPEYAQQYGLPHKDADRLDIKRFGYHGLAAASVVHQLRKADRLTPKLVIVHLGSGASVTAVRNGKSLDNSMGYSPLEGLIMSSRSGSLDVTAAQVIKAEQGLTDKQLDEYLNQASGLLGLGGSADVRELLQRESAGDRQAQLALNTYIYSVQKGIGAMAAALDGLDQLVFSGTVGERSAVIRREVVHGLNYLDLLLDAESNRSCRQPQKVSLISRTVHSKPIRVVPVDEAAEMARLLRGLVKD